MALHIAASLGHVEVTQTLSELGASVNATNRAGETALLLAARHGHNDVIRTLVANSASVALPDMFGWSALHHAADSGRASTVECLLGLGANPEVRSMEGLRPAALAVRRAANGHTTNGVLAILVSRMLTSG